jgi:competence protein ComEC
MIPAFLEQGADRQALWLPVAFGCGIAIYFALPREPDVWIVPLLLAGLGAGFWLIHKCQSLYLLSIFCLAILAGFGNAQWRAHQVAAPVLVKRLPPAELAGTVDRIEFRKSGIRLTLTDLSIQGLAQSQTPYRIRLTSRFDQKGISAGDRIAVRAVLMPPPEAPAPGSYDFVRRAWFERIGAVGYTISKVTVTSKPTGFRWRDQVSDIRQSLSKRVLNAFPDDKVAGHLAAALMTGHRGGIPEDVLGSLRDAGLAHLLAISGLHMGLLASLIFFASRAILALIEPVALRYPIKKYAALCSLSGAFAYLLLTGATVPTQRAFLMTALVLIAVMLDRRAVSMGLVAWAAGAVLIIAPESLLGPGFQMSFAAVVALIAVYERSRGKLSDWRRQAGGHWWSSRRLILYIGGVGLTTIVASLATSPVALAHFGRFASWGLAANLVAVPVMALWIMPWALLAFILMPFGLESVALGPMGAGINVVLAVARTVSDWPGAVQVLPAMPVEALALMALGGLWLCLYKPAKPELLSRAPGFISIAAGAFIWMMATAPALLVDGNAKLYGMVTQDGLLYVNNRRDSFTLRAWLAGQGLAKAEPMNAAGSQRVDDASLAEELRCDALGCLFRKNGRTISLVNDLRALADDCGISDAVISTMPLRRNCSNTALRLDRFDLWRNGTHALWVDKDGRISVQSVADARGQRLWTPVRQRTLAQGIKAESKLAKKR